MNPTSYSGDSHDVEIVTEFGVAHLLGNGYEFVCSWLSEGQVVLFALRRPIEIPDD